MYDQYKPFERELKKMKLYAARYCPIANGKLELGLFYKGLVRQPSCLELHPFLYNPSKGYLDKLPHVLFKMNQK